MRLLTAFHHCYKRFFPLIFLFQPQIVLNLFLFFQAIWAKLFLLSLSFNIKKSVRYDIKTFWLESVLFCNNILWYNYSVTANLVPYLEISGNKNNLRTICDRQKVKNSPASLTLLVLIKKCVISLLVSTFSLFPSTAFP